MNVSYKLYYVRKNFKEFYSQILLYLHVMIVVFYKLYITMSVKESERNDIYKTLSNHSQ